MWRFIKHLGWSLILKTALAIFPQPNQNQSDSPSLHHGLRQMRCRLHDQPTHVADEMEGLGAADCAWLSAWLQSFARLSSQAEKMREEIVAFVLRSCCSPLTVGCSETWVLSAVGVRAFWLPLHIQWNQMCLQLKDLSPEASYLVTVKWWGCQNQLWFPPSCSHITCKRNFVVPWFTA